MNKTRSTNKLSQSRNCPITLLMSYKSVKWDSAMSQAKFQSALSVHDIPHHQRKTQNKTKNKLQNYNKIE